MKSKCFVQKAKQEKRTDMHKKTIETMQHKCRALQNGIDVKDAENISLRQRIHELQLEVMEKSKRDNNSMDLTKKSANEHEIHNGEA